LIGNELIVVSKIPKNFVKWEEMGRGTIEYAGRLEAIPSSVYMSGKEAKDEIEYKLFEEGVLSTILGKIPAEDVREIRITHISAWMGYHVFCMEIKKGLKKAKGVVIDRRNTDMAKVAINLLPSTEKRPIFRNYWEIGKKASKTGYIARPICISEDGRLFVQEWIDGIPISSITGKEWKKMKKKIISLIFEAQGHLNREGIIFFPLMDYEIMYIENEGGKIVFLDITRLKSGEYGAEELYKLCQRSAINNTPVKVEDFLEGISKAYKTFEEFLDFISGWNIDLDLEEIWNKVSK